MSNNTFKIGDKVRYKHDDNFLGYVSDVDKGQLFENFDPVIRIHLDGNIIYATASELAVIHEKDTKSID